MKKYSCFLFDADGTLLDTRAMILECFKHTLKKFASIDIDKNLISNMIGLPYRKQIETFIPNLTDQLYKEIRDDHIIHQNQIFKNYVDLTPGVLETLEFLKKNGNKLGVVTSRNMETLKPFFDYFKIYDYFDCYITPENTLKHKPNPEPVLAALEKLNAKNDETIFIGDAVFDIESGNAANVDTCWTSWSPVDISNYKINLIISNMNELIPFAK